MNATSLTQTARHPAYRYGMLLFILPLLAIGLWDVFGLSRAHPRGSGLNLVVAGMLLVNHLSSSFLSPARQRAMLVPQFLFVGGGLLYVIGSVFRILPW